MRLHSDLTSPIQPETEEEVDVAVNNVIVISDDEDEDDINFTVVLNRKRRRQARKMLFASCESSRSSISSTMELPDIIAPDRGKASPFASVSLKIEDESSSSQGSATSGTTLDDKDEDEAIAKCTGVAWSDREKHFNEFMKNVHIIAGNGYCFLEAIRCVLRHDFGRTVSLEELQDQTEEEIIQNITKYMEHAEGRIVNIIRDAQRFIHGGQYTLAVGDVVVAAAANALHINLRIFQNDKGQMAIINQRSEEFSGTTINLVYHSDHYNALIDMSDEDFSRLHKEDDNDQFSQGHKKRKPRHKKTQQEDDNSDTDQISQRLQKTQQEDDNTDTDQFSQGLQDTEEEDDNTDNEKEETKDTDSEDQWSHNDENEIIDIEGYTEDEDETLTNVDNSANTLSNIEIHKLVEKAITGNRRPPKNMKSHLDTNRMAGLKIEKITEFPWDINGDHIFSMKCHPRDYMSDCSDGRYFKFSDSCRVNFNGIRKFGRCRGSKACKNERCPKVMSEGIVNCSEFMLDAFKKPQCRLCEEYAAEVWCGCIKVIEYDQKVKEATIWHQGEHICVLKGNMKKKKKFLADHLSLTTRKNTVGMRNDIVMYYLLSDEPEKAEEAADMTNNRRLFETMRRETTSNGNDYLNAPEVDGFENLSQVKKNLETVDNYFIYKMQSRAYGLGRSFIFKSSHQAAELAVKMDTRRGIATGHSDIESSLKKEWAYFDAMHDRALNYKTMTLWVFHPAMMNLQCLAIMECEKEDTQTVALFLNTFNEILADYTGQPGYQFHPHGFMVDEAGCNRKAVKEVYGPKRGFEVVGCHWHFKHCARMQLSRISPEDSIAFQDLYGELVTCYTQDRYDDVYTKMRVILKKHNREGWLKWWDIRKLHIVPCYRGNDMPGLNLAETGHSKLAKIGKHLKVFVAGINDVALFTTQAADYRAFINNEHTNLGYGPTQKEQQRRERIKENKRLNDVLRTIARGHIGKEYHSRELDERQFDPPANAKSKAPKHFETKNPDKVAEKTRKRKAMEEEYSDEVYSPAKRQTPTKVTPAKTPARVTQVTPSRVTPAKHGRSKKPTTRQRPQRRTQQQHYYQDSDDSNDGYRGWTDVDPVDELSYLDTNPPTVMMLPKAQPKRKGVFQGITKCFGCGVPYAANERIVPNNLIIRYQCKRHDAKDPEALGNAYFHTRDLHCLRRINADLEARDLYITSETLNNLTDQHVRLLKNKGYWDCMMANRLMLIQ